MSEIKEKILKVKEQKDTYIIPQNIKKDVKIFGVTGTYEGSGGVKLFETQEEMQDDTNPQEGDLAVIYRSEINPITEQSEFDGCIFPNEVVLDQAFTDNIYGSFRPVQQSGGWFDMMVELSPTRFRGDIYGDNIRIRIEYTSEDGITYTRTDGGEENIEFGTFIKYESWRDPFNTVLGDFIKIGGNYFEGLYEYGKYVNKDLIWLPNISNIQIDNENNMTISNNPITSECISTTDCIEWVNTEFHTNFISPCFFRYNNQLCALASSTGSQIYGWWVNGGIELSTSDTNVTGFTLYKFDNNMNYTTETISTKISSVAGSSRIAADINITSLYMRIAGAGSTQPPDYSYNWTETRIYLDTNWTEVKLNGQNFNNELLYFYGYMYVSAKSQLNTISDYVYKDKFYSNDGIGEGTLYTGVIDTQTKVNVFLDISNKMNNGLYLSDGITFKGQHKLTNIPFVLNTDGRTNMSYMFCNCYNIQNIPTINTVNAKNMSYMFYSCYNINPMQNLYMNNVENTFNMFFQCQSLTTVPNFNLSNVKDSSYMFDSCFNLTTVPNFNLSNVRNAFYMFGQCVNLTTVPNFDTHNVVNLSHLFISCNNLTTVPNFDTSSVTTMSSVFEGCINLTNIPNWNTNNVTNMCGTFSRCNKLTNIPNWYTNKVTDMSNMFAYCNNLTTVPNFDTHNVCRTDYMFIHCNNLTTVPNFDTSKIESAYNMFDSCYNLTSVFNIQADSLVNAAGMFVYCNKLTSINIVNTNNLRYISYMFGQCTNLTSVPNFNTSNVTEMAYTFWNCRKLTSIPNFDTHNVTNMQQTLYACYNITTPPNWNTSKVTTMHGMFDSSGVTSILNYDTSNVTNMSYFACNCTKLTTVPNLNTSKVYTFERAFCYCNNLSTASIHNIINMCLNSNVTSTWLKTLNTGNSYSPFYNTNITSSRYSNRLSELSAAGWNY